MITIQIEKDATIKKMSGSCKAGDVKRYGLLKASQLD